MRFDSGHSYDSSMAYDAGEPAQHIPTKKMKKPKLELQSKSDTELIVFARSIVTGLTGNSNFPTPDPAPAELGTAVDNFEDANNLNEVKQTEAQASTALKKQKRKALEELLSDAAAYVDRKAKGDEAKILSANMPVTADPTPAGPLPAPGDLRATATEDEGVIDLRSNKVKGASSYEWECRLHDGDHAWEAIKTSTATKILVTALTPGSLYAFRARAIGAAGPGTWSDEAVERAP